MNQTTNTNKILVVNLNQIDNTLYELEYIKPITQIIEKENIEFKTIHYSKITEKNIKQYSHIILSGTPLKEFEYLNHTDKFNWIKDTENKDKNILGICAGCQIIQKIFRAEQTNIQEIGLYKPEISIKDKILEKESLKEIYALHSNSFQVPKQFQIIAKTQIPQIIKYNNIYGCLFHPEVRNYQIISNFLKF